LDVVLKFGARLLRERLEDKKEGEEPSKHLREPSAESRDAHNLTPKNCRRTVCHSRSPCNMRSSRP
jgi:hypothetical protein